MKLKDCNGRPVKKADREEMADEVLEDLLSGASNYSFLWSGDSMVLAYICGDEVEVLDLKVRRTNSKKLNFRRTVTS